MGSVSLKIGDSTTRFRRAMLCPSATTDIGDHKNLFVIFEHVSLILREIEVSECRLHQIKRELAGYETLDPAKLGLPPELKLVLARHRLPLAATPALASPPWYPPSPIPTPAPSSSPSSPPHVLPPCCLLPDHRPSPSLQAHLQGLRAPPLPPPASPRLPLPRSLWNPNTKNPLSGYVELVRGPCHAVPCLACPGCASPGLGRALPGLVRGPNFSSLARSFLMGHAWHSPIL